MPGEPVRPPEPSVVGRLALPYTVAAPPCAPRPPWLPPPPGLSVDTPSPSSLAKPPPLAVSTPAMVMVLAEKLLAPVQVMVEAASSVKTSAEKVPPVTLQLQAASVTAPVACTLG